MKYPTAVLASAFALFSLSSCDDDNNNGLFPVYPPDQNNDGSISGLRTFIGKRVQFVGVADTTTVNNSGGFRVTTTTRETIDLNTEYLSSGVSISNGSARVVSVVSSSGPIPSIEDRITEINDFNANYQFGFAPNLRAATIISKNIDSSQYITNIVYNSDSTGTYSTIGDEVFNGVRTMTNESGTFTILF